MTDADGAAVLVDHDRQVRLPSAWSCDQEVARLHRLGDVRRRVRQRGHRAAGVALLGGLQDVEHVDDADHVVDARAVDRHARVLLVGDLAGGLAR